MNISKELTQKILEKILIGKKLSAFRFNVYFALEFDEEIELITDDVCWFGDKENWNKEVKKITGDMEISEPSIPLFAYKLATFPWINGKDVIVKQIILEDDYLCLLFENDEKMTVVNHNREDSSWDFKIINKQYEYEREYYTLLRCELGEFSIYKYILYFINDGILGKEIEQMAISKFKLGNENEISFFPHFKFHDGIVFLKKQLERNIEKNDQYEIIGCLMELYTATRNKYYIDQIIFILKNKYEDSILQNGVLYFLYRYDKKAVIDMSIKWCIYSKNKILRESITGFLLDIYELEIFPQRLYNSHDELKKMIYGDDKNERKNAIKEICRVINFAPEFIE